MIASARSAAVKLPLPRITIDDECTALAYAPDGRLAYATRHIFTVQKFDVQRDDIWILETDGSRRKIVNGEKMARGAAAFSYTITGLRWSSDGNEAHRRTLTQVN